MSIHPLRFHTGVFSLLDQRALPQREMWIDYDDPFQVAEAIRAMVVRGAPAIGVTAAYAMALAARRAITLPKGEQDAYLQRASRALLESRPTAVNLGWALRRMERWLSSHPGVDPTARAAGLLAEAQTVEAEDLEACRSIGRHGAALMPQRGNVLTHCNAGALATAGYGTALGVIRAAVEAGKQIKVLADETRPYLQGSRLTAWELSKDGIDVTVIPDNTAGFLMQRGEVACAVVGADRIARNGDVANKIGTYTVAVLCHEHRIPFYVAAPLSTLDPNIPDGSAIPIEERGSEEVLGRGAARSAPEGVGARYFAFDVTPARLVSALITEAGVATPPYEASIGRLLACSPFDRPGPPG